MYLVFILAAQVTNFDISVCISL